MNVERKNLIIPETSPTRYISGMVALNIPSVNGTGDTHEISTFHQPTSHVHRTFIVESGQEYDLVALLGTDGVHDVAATLDAMGVPHPPGPVYAATHARAIADLVLASVLRGGTADHVELESWMDDEGMNEVRVLLDKAAARLDLREVTVIDTWFERRRRHWSEH